MVAPGRSEAAEPACRAARRRAGDRCAWFHGAVERVPSPKDLRGAAAVTQTLAYVTGLAGVVAGALLYQDGQTAFAFVAWVLAFGAGAVLMIAAFLTRAIAALLARFARIEQDVAALVARGADRAPVPERDPWGHRPPY